MSIIHQGYNNMPKPQGYECIFGYISRYIEYINAEHYIRQSPIISKILCKLPHKNYIISNFYFLKTHDELRESIDYLNEKCIMLKNMDKDELRKIDDMHLIYICRLYQLLEIILYPPNIYNMHPKFNPHIIPLKLYDN